MNSIYPLILPNRAVTFMNYLASVASLIFLLETLIWNKITSLELISLTLAGVVVNDLMKNISKNTITHFSI